MYQWYGITNYVDTATRATARAALDDFISTHSQFQPLSDTITFDSAQLPVNGTVEFASLASTEGNGPGLGWSYSMPDGDVDIVGATEDQLVSTALGAVNGTRFIG